MEESDLTHFIKTDEQERRDSDWRPRSIQGFENMTKMLKKENLNNAKSHNRQKTKNT